MVETVCIQTHTQKLHVVPVRPLDFFMRGQMVLPIYPLPPMLSLGRHMPLLGRILICTKSSLFNQQCRPGSASYCNSSFIAFPQDFILYILNSTERSQSSFLHLKCLTERESSTTGWILHHKLLQALLK